MTDIAPTDPIAPETPAAPEDWKARYEAEAAKNAREVAERARERNLYRPAQQLLGQLDEDSQQSIMALTEMVARGDAAGVADWSLDTAEQAARLTGKDAAAIIAARQQLQGVNGVPTPTTPTLAPVPGQLPGVQTPPLDLETVRRAAREEAASYAGLERIKQQISNELGVHGYDPTDPAGQTIIHYMRVNPGTSTDDAVAWFDGQVLAKAQARATALAAAAGQTPPPAAAGATPGSSANENLTPGEKAAARLRAFNSQSAS